MERAVGSTRNLEPAKGLFDQALNPSSFQFLLLGFLKSVRFPICKCANITRICIDFVHWILYLPTSECGRHLNETALVLTVRENRMLCFWRNKGRRFSRLVAWLVGCLAGWLPGWLVGWRRPGWLAFWMADWLADLLTGPLTGWLAWLLTN